MGIVIKAQLLSKRGESLKQEKGIFLTPYWICSFYFRFQFCMKLFQEQNISLIEKFTLLDISYNHCKIFPIFFWTMGGKTLYTVSWALGFLRPILVYPTVENSRRWVDGQEMKAKSFFWLPWGVVRVDWLHASTEYHRFYLAALTYNYFQSF